MARQVSGSEKTLLEAIRDGDVPRPALMSWNEWQAWRSTTGRLPRLGTYGYKLTRAQEVALWKSVMNELYGDEWSIMLASRDVGLDGRPDEGGADEGRRVSAMDDEWDETAAAGAQPAAASFPERVSSPGSGYDNDTLPASPMPKMTGSRPVSSPGSGQQTPQSWHSDRPGTPKSLTERVLRPFRPESEELAVYTNRVKKQARALALAEAPLAEGALEHLLSRAKYEQMLFSQAKGDISAGARLLRREYAVEYTSEITGEDEEDDDREVRMAVLEDLLRDYGVDIGQLRASLEGIQDPQRAEPSASR